MLKFLTEARADLKRSIRRIQIIVELKIKPSEVRGFAMQPKSEWHEKAIRWFIEVMNK
jgi:hypothetical protein